MCKSKIDLLFQSIKSLMTNKQVVMSSHAYTITFTTITLTLLPSIELLTMKYLSSDGQHRYIGFLMICFNALIDEYRCHCFKYIN